MQDDSKHMSVEDQSHAAYLDVFRSLGLSRMNDGAEDESFQCPACQRWGDVSFDWINLLVDCSCGWCGDIFSVVMKALDIDDLAAIRLLNLRYTQRAGRES